MADRIFTQAEYDALPKDNWSALIKSWCFRKGHTMPITDKGVYRTVVPARLPYRRGDDGLIYVDESFLKMAGL